MSNKSYCRFENTLGDLQDCYEHMNDDKQLSQSESRARERLINLCHDIAQEYCEEE